jgi:integrase
MAPNRPRLKYVHMWLDTRHGSVRPRYYFRRAGSKRVPLPGMLGSPEFMAAYAAAMAGQTPITIGARRVKLGTVAALVVAYLTSPKFLAKSRATQATYRNIVERFRAEHGDKPVADLERKHLTAMLAKKVKTPAAANHWLRLIKTMMTLAVDEGMRPDNPAAGLQPIEHRSPGFHTWTEEQIAAFEARHPIGTKARLALALLLYTAQRRSDVVRMGRQHVRGGAVHIRQQKTGKAMPIPLHPALAAVIEATPTNQLTFLVTEYDKPFSPAGFGNWFRQRCDEARLPKECTAHGLRKAACRRLAEAGCSASQIAAISGHVTLREVERYVKMADQERLARAAIGAVAVAFPENESGAKTGNGE